MLDVHFSRARENVEIQADPLPKIRALQSSIVGRRVPHRRHRQRGPLAQGLHPGCELGMAERDRHHAGPRLRQLDRAHGPALQGRPAQARHGAMRRSNSSTPSGTSPHRCCRSARSWPGTTARSARPSPAARSSRIARRRSQWTLRGHDQVSDRAPAPSYLTVMVTLAVNCSFEFCTT